MNKYPSPIVLMVFGVCCIFTGMFLAYFAERYDQIFSPLQSGTVMVPGSFDFSSPSSSVAASTESAATVYWHSVEEMQKFAGVEPDNIWGPLTDAAYRQARDRWYCDMSARATWPSDELVVLEGR